MKISWRCEYVRCGNKRCGSCPHGPYWYGYWKEGGRTRKRYHGKDDPRPGAAGRGRRRPADYDPADDIFDRRTATPMLGCLILGVEGIGDWPAIQRAYKRRCLEEHPDRGGTIKGQQRVNAAFSYLKALLGK